ncbi:TetR/AcrR family transcriptional regulator [Homoserinibacter sp. YIM 151385]|uniref:TetR/AcrR family transcriptional regulator n=1 Tax=Homoserinibacter sp. YIM 151385 TaxID=2985506 RepID=UPI0022F01DD8|nr:TetR/AcrR family transcriptional regulator [Homoserinibacter sp. YIM 151385]WBU36733.1 TetR/AcrR family transcriptional regulator [Homoserinibacter sp. YIM 151385]
MAWDTEATRRKLLAAGARQFAAHGLAGARIDAIGRDAGVNKERIYRYFGDKERFFGAVLAEELRGILDGIHLEGEGPVALAGFARELLARCARHPELGRLLGWESLELDRPAAAETRREICADVAGRIRASLPGISRETAEQLLLSTIVLATGVDSLVRIADTVLGSPAQHEARAAEVVVHVEALAASAQAAANR